MAADGRTLKASGIGDVRIDLLNGVGKTQALLKETIHAPNMAFTLISINKLDQAKCTVTFENGLCTIRNPTGKTMATIPCSNGLYHTAPPEPANHIDYANVAMVKMTIAEAHHKLGHIADAAVKHAISTGTITGIELDQNSKLEFCEACAKAKATRHPFPKYSHTHATKYRDHIHWDLWGPASVQSLNGNHFVAACMIDATCETTLYFQKKKSETYGSYKRDEAYIETQTGNCVKIVRSD